MAISHLQCAYYIVDSTYNCNPTRCQWLGRISSRTGIAEWKLPKNRRTKEHRSDCAPSKAFQPVRSIPLWCFHQTAPLRDTIMRISWDALQSSNIWRLDLSSDSSLGFAPYLCSFLLYLASILASILGYLEAIQGQNSKRIKLIAVALILSLMLQDRIVGWRCMVCTNVDIHWVSVYRRPTLHRYLDSLFRLDLHPAERRS